MAGGLASRGPHPLDATAWYAVGLAIGGHLGSSTEPVIVGKQAFGEFYATQRFNHTDLRAILVNRIVLGNRVIDHERISGILDEPFDVAVVYEIANGLIQRTWTFAA